MYLSYHVRVGGSKIIQFGYEIHRIQYFYGTPPTKCTWKIVNGILKGNFNHSKANVTQCLCLSKAFSWTKKEDSQYKIHTYVYNVMFKNRLVTENHIPQNIPGIFFRYLVPK